MVSRVVIAVGVEWDLIPKAFCCARNLSSGVVESGGALSNTPEFWIVVHVGSGLERVLLIAITKTSNLTSADNEGK